MIEMKEGGRFEGQNTLFVFFTGGNPAAQKKGFNFERTAEKLGYPALLLRDVSGCFYNTENYDDVLVTVKAICGTFRDEGGRLVFIGTSMGGYGAFKFGAEIVPDKIIAFSPQTQRNPKDGRPPAPDISHFYRAMESPPAIDVHICKTSNYDSDALDAEIMKQAAGANVIMHDCNVHNVAGALKKQEKLFDIIAAEK